MQNPQKILAPYIKEGMTVLELGCGPGFFTFDIAQMVGTSGRVIAADLQQGMLEKIRLKMKNSELKGQITLHRCTENTIGISDNIDFIFLFYMVHEVSDKKLLFNEIELLLNENGSIFIVEPPFHVSQKAFEEMICIAEGEGLRVVERPKLFLNKTALLKKH
ncbi:MAG: class I SAM-dependent methyltransferase [Desulfobacterales bacterium]|nr:class I SAM-dependent methyltransferase [Deltaproteobacteria bacterium]NNK95951.1 class I SAM-dependent methyltransferase [Desulfobacterales bacterium]